MSRPKGSMNKVKVTPDIAPEVQNGSESVAEVNDEYRASIKVLGKIYESTGSTILEAITNLTPDGIVRGMSIVTIQKGEKRQEKILPRVMTSRLFSPQPAMREVAIKIVTERFI